MQKSAKRVEVHLVVKVGLKTVLKDKYDLEVFVVFCKGVCYLDLLIYVCWIFSSEIITNNPLNNYDPLHSL